MPPGTRRSSSLARVWDDTSSRLSSTAPRRASGRRPHYLLLTRVLTTHYSLLTTHYSLLTTNCSLLTTAGGAVVLLTTHYTLLTTYYGRRCGSTYCSPHTTYCSLLAMAGGAVARRPRVDLAPGGRHRGSPPRGPAHRPGICICVYAYMHMHIYLSAVRHEALRIAQASL